MLHRLSVRLRAPVGQLGITAPQFPVLSAASIRTNPHARPAVYTAPVLSHQFAGICNFASHAKCVCGTRRRSFAAAAGSEGSKVAQESRDSDDAALEAKEKNILRRYAGVTTVVGAGFLGYSSWWLTSQAMKMVGAVYASPHIVAYAGFWFGFATTSMLAALAIAVYRLTFIRPEYAFRDTFQIVRNDAAVIAALGNNIKDGKLKSYEIKGGRFTVSGALPQWLPHKLQMMYIVYGPKGAGLVTTVVEKKPSLIPRKLDPNLLAVDFLDENDTMKAGTDTLLLVGEKSQLEVRDNIRRLLKVKVAS